VSTVLFNANPLMRFDGYYVLTDLVGIPNLQTRANRRLGNLVSRCVLGVEAIPDPHRPDKGSWFRTVLLVGYAGGAYGYRWLVASGFIVFLTTFLKPYRLAILGHLLAVMAVFGMVVMPMWQIYRTLKGRWTAMRIQKPRALLGTGIAVLVVVALLFTPLPMRIDVPFILQLRRPTPVYVTTPGLLAAQNVRDGDRVEAGRELASLQNLDLTKELRKLELEHGRERERRHAAERLRDSSTAIESDGRLKALREQIEHLDRQRRQLNLRVQEGVSGTVVNPPRASEIGKFMQQGSLFCEIGDPKKLDAYLVVEHSDIGLVAEGRTVWLKLPGHTGAILAGEVGRIAAADLRDLPPALASVVGGGVAYAAPNGEEDADPTDPKAAQKKAQAKRAVRPLQRSYAAEVHVSNPEGVLRSGLRGTARIDVGWRTLAWRIERTIRQTFHFRM
jgi:putative peptide zinc metalloprotease protein